MESTDINELAASEPWLSSEKLVVKPDMLFGKRGKSGLVGLNLHLDRVASYVKDRIGKEVEIGGCKGPVTTFPLSRTPKNFTSPSFLIVWAVALASRSVVGLKSKRTGTRLVPPLGIVHFKLLCFFDRNPAAGGNHVKGKIEEFIKAVFILFLDEPFTMVDGNPYPLDMREELDDTAAFKNFKKWGDIDFPIPFGRIMSATEKFVHGLDEKTSASLKFTVLNPQGRIWTMVAGGGASVIYADSNTVGLHRRMKFCNMLELSLMWVRSISNTKREIKNKNRKEDQCVKTHKFYTFTQLMTTSYGRKRALLIGGGIANFTDLAATFNGIIKALREKASSHLTPILTFNLALVWQETKLKAARMHIFVRRGGPNYQIGLAKMLKLGEEIDIPLECFFIIFQKKLLVVVLNSYNC
ncbi:hypothetical protein IEQ34_005227 [Dendrobium chrysotoxum]|uniref:ATP-citrate synthase citrate-binding domain-containing protein n=1 Tax=Dendrobium chrysotoxum TaxID=161865 RepID=A0AAV7HBP8_DENCH|nr:hypothetical protein IEQ34_005227 [Dendrobium chrysotoxum]